VQSTVDKVGYCTVVASEGTRDAAGHLLADAGTRDAFGHVQLGGVAPVLANLVHDKLGLKVHWALPDYLQRSARHAASRVDVDQARAVGKAAVDYAIKGMNATMPVIKRRSDKPYRWTIEPAPLKRIANREKKMPKSFIRRDGFGITPAARRYLAPLIRGTAPPPLGRDGLPQYVRLKNVAVGKKLAPWHEG
jgi:6-phosphofructokinase 1